MKARGRGQNGGYQERKTDLSKAQEVRQRALAFGRKFAIYFTDSLQKSHSVALKEAKADASAAGGASRHAAAAGKALGAGFGAGCQYS